MSGYQPIQSEGAVNLLGGGKLAYAIYGEAKGATPLLLLRPLGGSMALWGSFPFRLAEDRQVIAYDYRGTGKSSAKAPLGLTTTDLARDAVFLLDALRIGRAHVFGISLGGMVATRLAYGSPLRVAKLCLAATPVRGLALKYQDFREKFGLVACLLRRTKDIETCLARRILSPEFRRGRPEEVARLERMASSISVPRATLMKYAAAGAAHDASGIVGQIKAPTLVLAGERDTVLGRGPAKELALMMPNARFEIIDSGHDLSLENPGDTAASVRAFLREA